MTKATDAKLELLTKSPCCAGLNPRQIEALGRLTELVIVPEGSVLRSRTRGAAWSYYILKGTALVTSGDDLTIANAGTWLFADPLLTPAEVTAATGVVALAVGFREVATVKQLLRSAGPRP